MAGIHITMKEKRVFLAAFVILGGAFAYSCIVAPVASRWGGLDRQIAAKTGMLRRDKLLLARYAELGSEYKTDAKRPRQEDGEGFTARIISSVETLSRQSSCVIVSLKPRMPRHVGAHQEIAIDVSAEGKMEGLTALIYGIETSKELMRIKQFSISSKSSQSDRLSCDFVVSRLVGA